MISRSVVGEGFLIAPIALGQICRRQKVRRSSCRAVEVDLVRAGHKTKEESKIREGLKLKQMLNSFSQRDLVLTLEKIHDENRITSCG
ncbi:hypothetical protein K449DRAFT_52509 [Hypoxylon sp. EC38]|nr:hypothetical protein K449DRAFT_52509 [Hypoxylon sp. EC38]